MVTEKQIPEIVEKVRKRLSEKGHLQGMELALEDRDYRLEDDWLYLCVSLPSPNVHAFDYSEILGEIETELRKEDIDNVLLVPTLAW